MATVNSDITMKWGVLAAGTPNIEFWYPADVPSNQVKIYHGVSNNVPNRRIIKTIKMGISAGGVHNFRDVGFEDELIKLDVVLATKEEADEFTNFFKNIVKGSSNVFYFRNNFTGQESIVRSMRNTLNMGEAEGHPYSFSLLLRKEDPYTGSSLTMKWDITASAPITTFSSGFLHSGAVNSIGELYTAGDNSLGQIGQSSTPSFVKIGSATNWIKVVCGQYHTVALNSAGELYGTGFNWTGELGLGHNSQVNVFTKLGTDTDWVDIAAGGDNIQGYGHTLALKSNGDLYTSGHNGFGQLGVGDWGDRNVFTFCKSNVVQIAANQNHSFLIDTSGSLWGFGENSSFPVLGLGDYVDRNIPVKVGIGTDWLEISTGYSHALGIRGSGPLGTLWVWGNDNNGQLGLGGSGELDSPVQLGASSNWSNVECRGFDSSYAALSSLFYGWGRGSDGELGLGDNLSYDTPQLLIGGTWVGIWSGWNTVFGRSGGSGYSAGRNSSGQLGLGDYSDKDVFTNIVNL
jgi:alpha-tubulin suppressor-like RCC1 family protein